MVELTKEQFLELCKKSWEKEFGTPEKDIIFIQDVEAGCERIGTRVIKELSKTLHNQKL